jgi:purine-nucleoside phosphorylase
MTTGTFEQLQELKKAVYAALGPVSAPIALVLGSGLGGVASEIEQARRIAYSELPHMAASTVAGHAGELVVGRWQGKDVIALAGRVHHYEGHAWPAVTLPTRLLAALGAKVLIVTNAAGSVHTRLQPGNLMLIVDQLNLTGSNPLIGPNDDRLGPRFPDMTAAFDPALRALTKRIAAEQGTPLHEGVYCGLTGPSYETPAEVRMLAGLGGDAVGMSTVAEVIVARHMGMRVLGLSCITNLGAGLGDGTLDHSHVAVVAKQATAAMTRLVAGVVAAI